VVWGIKHLLEDDEVLTDGDLAYLITMTLDPITLASGRLPPSKAQPQHSPVIWEQDQAVMKGLCLYMGRPWDTGSLQGRVSHTKHSGLTSVLSQSYPSTPGSVESTPYAKG
jgi:hypothetical protein